MLTKNPHFIENTTPRPRGLNAIRCMKRLATTVSLASLLLGSGALVAGCQTTSTTATSPSAVTSSGSSMVPLARTRSSR
jgi:hypothetical protein